MAKKSKQKNNLNATYAVPNNKATRRGVYIFGAIVLFASALPLVASLVYSMPLWLIIASAVYLVLVGSSIRSVPQWERVVILRLGRFHRVAGPGVFFVIPFFDSTALHVDQRTMVTPFTAEEALTANLVPTDIDAVLFWVVINPEKACFEVENYPYAVSWAAQTALRDAIGRVDLADISTRRTQIDRELKDTLNEKTTEWGISILSVEIRNIIIPKDLQEAMSREAQAQQERNARLVLAEMEKQISELLLDAAKVYHEDELAFQIRMASMVNESVKESNNGLIVVPSMYSEGFNTGNIEELKKTFKAKTS